MPLTYHREPLTAPRRSLGTRVVLWLLSALLVLAVCIAATLVAVFAFERATWAPLVESLVQRATGRTLTIEGNLDARAGRVVSVRADRIRLSNADWGSSADMLIVDGMEVSVDLARLLDGLLVIDNVQVAGSKLLFEQNEQGRSNWWVDAGSEQSDPDPERLAAIPLLIARAELADIDITVQGPAITRPLVIHLDSVSQRAGEKDELNATLVGSIDQHAVTVRAQIKPFTQLLAAREVQFSLRGDLDVLDVAADGQVDDLLNPKQPRVRLTANAPDVAQIAAMFALPEITTGALDLTASMQPADGHHEVDVVGSVGFYTLDAHARLQALDSLDGLSIDVAAAGPNLRTAANLAGLAGLPALPFTVRSQAALSGSRLEIGNTRFETGDNRLTVSGVMSRFPSLAGTNLELDLQGNNVLEFSDLLGLPDAAQLEPAPFSINADLDYSARDKQTFTARATIGRIEGQFRGQLTDYPAFTGSRLDYLVNGPDSALILRALGRPSLLQESYILHGDIERTAEGVQINRGVLLLGANELKVTGTIGNQPLREHTQLSVRYQGPDFGPIARVAGYTGFVPAGDATLALRAHVEPDGLHIGEFSADIGPNSARASGLISVRSDRAGSHLDLSAKGPQIADALPPELLEYIDGQQAFDVTGRLETRANELAIRSLSATLGDMQLQASGRIGLQKPLTNSAFTVALRGANLAKVVPQQMPYQFPSQAFSVSGDLALGQDGLVLDAVKAAVGPDRLTLSGTVPLATPSNGLRLEIAASGPNLAALVPPELDQLDIDQTPYELAGNIVLADDKISVQRLSFSTAKGSLRGELILALRDPRTFGRFDLQGSGINLDEFVPAMPQYQPAPVSFQLQARGGWDAERVTIDKGHIELDKTSIDVQGEIDLPPNVTATRLSLAARGDSLADLGEIRGLVLPPQDFRIDALLQGDAAILQLPELDARIGDSDVRGSFSIEFADKPAIEIALKSDLLDLSKLLPVDDDPTRDDQALASVTDDGRLIPDLKLPVEQLNSIDLVVRIDIGELRLPRHTLRKIDLDASLRDGDLTVTQFRATATQGEINASFRATATGDHIATNGSLEGVDIVLGKSEQRAGGASLPKQNFHLAFATAGATLRELAAKLNGSARIAGGEGRLENNLAMRLLGDFTSELLSTVNPFVKQEPYTLISCSAAFADIANGVIVINPGAVVQTGKLNIFADGQIDLNTERISLRFNTAARTGIGVSVADFVNPFVGVGGTLANPKLGVDPKNSALEGGVAYATGGWSIVAKSLIRRWL
ncbi:MAG: AsmA family protein, partial [Gammaproteobacteria bacterium]|nr:AsmA family protein [Gammaproteobacteria bacterium]